MHSSKNTNWWGTMSYPAPSVWMYLCDCACSFFLFLTAPLSSVVSCFMPRMQTSEDRLSTAELQLQESQLTIQVHVASAVP